MVFIYSKMQKQQIFTALEYTRSVLGVLFQCPKVSPLLDKPENDLIPMLFPRHMVRFLRVDVLSLLPCKGRDIRSLPSTTSYFE